MANVKKNKRSSTAGFQKIQSGNNVEQNRSGEGGSNQRVGGRGGQAHGDKGCRSQRKNYDKKETQAFKERH